MLDDPRAPRSNLVEKRSNATRVEVRIALADAEEQGALGRERENLGVAARVARPRRVERVGEERAREDAVASFGVRAHLRGDSRGDARAVGVSRENPARHAGEGGVSLGGRERAARASQAVGLRGRSHGDADDREGTRGRVRERGGGAVEVPPVEIAPGAVQEQHRRVVGLGRLGEVERPVQRHGRLRAGVIARGDDLQGNRARHEARA